MTKSTTPRILHLPESVGGNAFCLSNAMRQLGANSHCWILKPNYLNYGYDKSISTPNDGYLKTELKRLLALRYIFQFDIIFFNFGSTLFRPLALTRRPGWSLSFYLGARAYMAYATVMQRVEFALLKLLGRNIYVQYQGDDARQGDYCRAHYEFSPATEVDEHYYHPASDEHKRQQIRLFEKHCDGIYALNPDLLNVLPASAKFLPYSHISLDEWVPQPSTTTPEQPLRIGHAPTHRGVKGTQHILAALENLRKEGLSFELVLIEGMTQQEAKATYATLDLVIDQLFVGWYGGLAVEAMALGKPVVAYLRDADLHHIPSDMRTELPLIRATVLTLESDLRTILQKTRKEIALIGSQSRKYVEKWHDQNRIAAEVLSYAKNY